MSIWVVVILVGVLAMVLGPVMMLQPNSSQRSKMELRQRALTLGLKVSMGVLPRQATDVQAPGSMPVYCLPRISSRDWGEPWLLVRTAYAHDRHFKEHWAWSGSGRPGLSELQRLERVVTRLPASVQGLRGDHQGWCCYWNERGGIQQLEQLANTLSELASPQAGL